MGVGTKEKDKLSDQYREEFGYNINGAPYFVVISESGIAFSDGNGNPVTDENITNALRRETTKEIGDLDTYQQAFAKHAGEARGTATNKAATSTTAASPTGDIVNRANPQSQAPRQNAQDSPGEEKTGTANIPNTAATKAEEMLAPTPEQMAEGNARLQEISAEQKKLQDKKSAENLAQAEASLDAAKEQQGADLANHEAKVKEGINQLKELDAKSQADRDKRNADAAVAREGRIRDAIAGDVAWMRGFSGRGRDASLPIPAVNTPTGAKAPAAPAGQQGVQPIVPAAQVQPGKTGVPPTVVPDVQPPSGQSGNAAPPPTIPAGGAPAGENPPAEGVQAAESAAATPQTASGNPPEGVPPQAQAATGGALQGGGAAAPGAPTAQAAQGGQTGSGQTGAQSTGGVKSWVAGGTTRQTKARVPNQAGGAQAAEDEDVSWNNNIYRKSELDAELKRCVDSTVGVVNGGGEDSTKAFSDFIFSEITSGKNHAELMNKLEGVDPNEWYKVVQDFVLTQRVDKGLIDRLKGSNIAGNPLVGAMIATDGINALRAFIDKGATYRDFLNVINLQNALAGRRELNNSVSIKVGTGDHFTGNSIANLLSIYTSDNAVTIKPKDTEELERIRKALEGVDLPLGVAIDDIIKDDGNGAYISITGATAGALNQALRASDPKRGESTNELKGWARNADRNVTNYQGGEIKAIDPQEPEVETTYTEEPVQWQRGDHWDYFQKRADIHTGNTYDAQAKLGMQLAVNARNQAIQQGKDGAAAQQYFHDKEMELRDFMFTHQNSGIAQTMRDYQKWERDNMNSLRTNPNLTPQQKYQYQQVFGQMRQQAEKQIQQMGFQLEKDAAITQLSTAVEASIARVGENLKNGQPYDIREGVGEIARSIGAAQMYLKPSQLQEFTQKAMGGYFTAVSDARVGQTIEDAGDGYIKDVNGLLDSMRKEGATILGAAKIGGDDEAVMKVAIEEQLAKASKAMKDYNFEWLRGKQAGYETAVTQGESNLAEAYRTAYLNTAKTMRESGALSADGAWAARDYFKPMKVAGRGAGGGGGGAAAGSYKQSVSNHGDNIWYFLESGDLQGGGETPDMAVAALGDEMYQTEHAQWEKGGGSGSGRREPQKDDYENRAQYVLMQDFIGRLPKETMAAASGVMAATFNTLNMTTARMQQKKGSTAGLPESEKKLKEAEYSAEALAVSRVAAKALWGVLMQNEGWSSASDVSKKTEQVLSAITGASVLYAPGSEIREGIYDKNQIAAGVQARNAMSASYADYNEFKNAQNPRIADNANNSDTNIIGSFTKSLPDNIVALFNDAAGGEGVNVKNWIKAHANIVTLDADTAFGSGQRESFGETVISIPTKNGAIKYVLTTKGKESYAIPIMSWKEGVDPTAVSGAVKLGG